MNSLRKDSSKPTISVVIPTYNCRPFIKNAIYSVLSQTLLPLEVIIVDDGSTDNTCEMVNIFGGLVKYVFQENQGISGARNTGIRLACGEWIALLDADDVWHRQKLEIQSAILESHPTIGLLATELYTMDMDGVPLSEPPPARVISFGLETISLLQLLEQSCYAPSTVIFKKTLAESLGGFSTQLRASEDMLMWWMIAAQKQILKIDAKLVGYRIHSSSVSFQYQLMANNKKKGGPPCLRIHHSARKFFPVALHGTGPSFLRSECGVGKQWAKIAFTYALPSSFSKCFIVPRFFRENQKNLENYEANDLPALCEKF